MRKTYCRYHPDYQPESGEPTGKCRVDEFGELSDAEHYKGPVDATFPCPNCWLARARYFQERVQSLPADTERLDKLHRWVKDKVKIVYFGGVTNLFFVDDQRGRTLREAIDRADEAKAKP